MGTAKTTTLPTFVAGFVSCSLFPILWLASSYGFVIGCSYFCRFSHFVFIYLYTYNYIYVLIFFYIILFTGSHLYVSTDFWKLTTKARNPWNPWAAPGAGEGGSWEAANGAGHCSQGEVDITGRWRKHGPSLGFLWWECWGKLMAMKPWCGNGNSIGTPLLLMESVLEFPSCCFETRVGFHLQ